MSSQDPLADGLAWLRKRKGPSLRTAGIGVLLLLSILGVWSAVFTVGAEEVGVVMTFGRYSRQTPPGLRVKWPRPIQTVMKVAVQRQLKAEFGFRTVTAGVRTQYAEGAFNGESLMLTGDLNVAVVSWTTQFRINDPYNYLFKVRNLFDPAGVSSADTFRDMN